MAHNSNKIKLKISAKSSYIINTMIKDRPQVCLISIVNIGNKPVKITNIGWEVGKRKKKKSFMQVTSGSTLGNIPKTLMESEELNIDIAFIRQETNWIEIMAKIAIDNNINTLKLVVATSVDETFKIKADENLIAAINKKKKELEEIK